jgi:hypothetical protein
MAEHSEPLRLLFSNHEGHKEKQEVALISLCELRFFMVEINSTYYRKSATLQNIGFCSKTQSPKRYYSRSFEE